MPDFTGGVVTFDGVGYPIYRDLQGIFDINPTVFMRNARDTNQKSHKITGNYGYKKPK